MGAHSPTNHEEDALTAVTIIGAGNMGTAIAGAVAKGGNTVQVLTKDPQKAADAIPAATHGTVGEPITGDIVILALPYAAVADVLSQYAGQLDDKVIVDLTNPVDFATFDSLVVPVGSSATEVIAKTLPGSSVLKAFNTTFAATLVVAPSAWKEPPSSSLVMTARPRLPSPRSSKRVGCLQSMQAPSDEPTSSKHSVSSS
jgi:hypothetical protein